MLGPKALEDFVCMLSWFSWRIKFLAIGKAETVKVEMHPVSLRSICPVVSKDEEEKRLLVEDLAWIGCKDLLAQPWSLRREDMVQEFS